MLPDEVQEAQELLSRVESECKKVGLGLNGPKIKCLAYNIENPAHLRTRDDTKLEFKDDFKYLGSWVDSTKKDISVRKALAWRALNGMNKIWRSGMSRDLKKFFLSTVESILLYGCESWAMAESVERSLNGTYSRMLRAALNVHWSSHTPNEVLYGKLPLVSD